MKEKLFIIRLSIALIIFITGLIGILGIFYPLPIFNIQFTPLYQRVIIDFSIIALVLFTLFIIFTLLFGRIYCSLLCPMGIYQEIITLITKRDNEKQPNRAVKYFISAILFGVLTGGSTLLIKYIDPYTIFSSGITLTITGIITIVLIGILTIFKNRFFCTNICPVGCILGLISKISLFKMYIDKNECLSCSMCERNCPSGCIESDEQIIDNETCIKCFKCISNCPKEAIHYGIKPKEKIKYSPKRRELITTASALIVLGIAIKSGIELGKNIIKKTKEIILPPGSVDTERMYNKCLNCNLCIKACPNKILVKSNKEFEAVHIDYSKGENYCKYDCIECSKACPSGAIKKITLEEKQRTRIAMAVIDSEKCQNCRECINNCPVKAININEKGQIIINSSNCIGCGTCKKYCNNNAIEIFAINEQQRV